MIFFRLPPALQSFWQDMQEHPWATMAGFVLACALDAIGWSIEVRVGTMAIERALLGLGLWVVIIVWWALRIRMRA